MTRRCWRAVAAAGVLAWTPYGGHAAVDILPDASMSVDGTPVAGQADIGRHPATREILAAFTRAEESVQRRDLDGLMTFYARSYDYHGLKRADVRRVWSEVFAHYRDLSSTHLFSDVRVARSGSGLRAEVACTGGLYGAEASTGVRVTLDSWFREVHHLVFEDGAWRFAGNPGVAPPPMPFTAAPHHPLF